MQLDERLLELLEELFSLRTEKCTTMELTGSYLLPYIRHYHDIDINIYFKENMPNIPFIQPEHRERYKEINEILKNEYKVGLVFRSLKDLENYRYFAFKYLYGEYLSRFIPEDIEARKKDYSLYLKEVLWPIVEHQTERFGNPTKQSYHVLIGLYSIANNFEDFTEEQIENINIIHDQEDKEKINELYEWMRQQIENIQF